MKGASDNTATLSYDSLKKWAIAYMMLPVVVFLMGWLRFHYALPLTLMAVLGVYFGAHVNDGITCDLQPAMLLLGDSYENEKRSRSVSVPIAVLVSLVILALAWCVLGGQGGFWYQSTDWGVRNAMFRDLITYEWPVHYRDGSDLIMYFGHFLPPALIGKIAATFFADEAIVWCIANIAMLLWTAAGVFLIELLVITTLGCDSRKTVFFSVALFILFSTPDVIGLILSKRYDYVLSELHLEWWATRPIRVAQYSSFTSCLFWVFHESIVVWIGTLCFVNEKTVRSFLLLWLPSLLCGTFGCIGLALLMGGMGFVLLSQAHAKDKWISLLHDIASPQNIAACIVAIPCIFFIGEYPIGSASTEYFSENVGNVLSYPFWIPDDSRSIKLLIAFIGIEALLLPLIVLQRNRHRGLYWLMLITLLLCPFIRVGGFNFCMRASMPALLVLYLYCADYLLYADRSSLQSRVTGVLLALILALGAATPLMEFYRGFHNVFLYGVEACIPDEGTMDGRSRPGASNIQSSEGSFFFTYFAR